MAKKRAEESDRLKSAFLANMSHEIRTPLNGILGFTELIVDPSFDQKEKENMAHIILENGDLLMTIINDVLDISKIEAGQLELRYSQFKTGKLIREVSTMFLAKTNKNKLNLVLNVSEETYEIVLNSDFIRLKQVLSNLVSNAMKYTDKGTVEIGAFKEENSLIIYVKYLSVLTEAMRIQRKLAEQALDLQFQKIL
jgi:signal transduction histidine kinase